MDKPVNRLATNGRRLSLSVLIFAALIAVALVTVAVPGFSSASNIDKQVRRAGALSLCGELNGMIENWDGDIDSYISARQHELKRDDAPLAIRVSGGVAPSLGSPPQGRRDAFVCDRAIAMADANQFARPLFYARDSGEQETLGARMEEELSSGGVRWAEVEVDIGTTLQAAIRAQFGFAMATLFVALVISAVTAKIFGYRMRSGVQAVNRVLTEFAAGHNAARVPDNPHDTTELTDLKLQVNAALGEIAAQTKARESAAKQIVHDIRSPLGKVEMWLRPHAAAGGQLARAATTVSDVIEGTRLILVGLSQTRQSDETFSLTDRVMQHLRDMEAMAEELDVAFVPEIEPDLLITASPPAVDRLIGNLLQNVLDHGAAGTAIVRLRHDAELFHLEIDNPLRNAPIAEAGAARNFGVGLTSVRDIAVQYGWTFDQRSEAGRHRVKLIGQRAPSL